MRHEAGRHSQNEPSFPAVAVPIGPAAATWWGEGEGGPAPVQHSWGHSGVGWNVSIFRANKKSDRDGGGGGTSNKSEQRNARYRGASNEGLRRVRP